MTYGELKNLIQNYLQNSETSFTTYLPDIIKQAEDRILENVQLPVFRKNQVGSLSADNQYLGIPTDFLAPYSLSFTNSSNQTFLINKDVNWIRELYPNASTTGEPEYYAIFDNEYSEAKDDNDTAAMKRYEKQMLKLKKEIENRGGKDESGVDMSNF